MSLKVFEKLEERRAKGSYREMTLSQRLIDFVSNDYLGLSRSKELYEMIRDRDSFHANGSTGSRLLAGNSSEMQALETKLARIFKAEACLLFNSGYVANLAVLSTLPQRGDSIIYDSLSHVCIKEGSWLSKAQTFAFTHNDPVDLERRLSNAAGEKFVVIESVYSMDGDMASFTELIAIAKKYGAHLIIDEAHSTGMYGERGEGLVCHLGVEQQFLARVYTFGKAMGVHGAAVVGSREFINYLINFARPFIYTTALPPHSVLSIDCAFEYLSENKNLQMDCSQRIKLFNDYFAQVIGVSDSCRKLPSDTPIQPVVISGNEKVKRIASEMQSAGFDVRPILSPTVKEGAERLRISVHAFNTEDDITKMIDKLKTLL